MIKLKKNDNLTYLIIFICIIAGAVFIRFYNWPNAITQVNCDEIMTAVSYTHLDVYKRQPIELNGYKIVIANTKKKRSLAESKYNERCKECQTCLLYTSPSDVTFVCVASKSEPSVIQIISDDTSSYSVYPKDSVAAAFIAALTS